MSKCVSYSLFGFGRPQEKDSFSFLSYLRGLMVNIRMARLLFPDWEVVVNMDTDTHAHFATLFSANGVSVRVHSPAPLCMAMLWRMMPIFEMVDNKWKYTHVLCRDTDSPPTYRDAQAVQHWIEHDNAMHAITDSVSHNVPLLGGMIGARPAYFSDRVGARSWDAMMRMGENSGIDFSQKGADQTFLNRFIYPKFGAKGSESITQHYVLGHGDTFLNDFHNRIPSITVLGVPESMKESDGTCGHIGAAGFYSPAMFKFLRAHKERFTDLIELEKQYPNIFYWCFDGTFD